ncbi:MAG: pH regulation protein F [Chloroflexi bacterium AL-N5]|nr:pH regulation protein F [Chloroflexi bacterium AL-N5]
MHPIVFYTAIFWTVVLLGASIILIIRAHTLMIRLLAIDTITLVLIALLSLLSHFTQEPYYLDVGLMLALMAFIATVAVARYYGEGRIF